MTASTDIVSRLETPKPGSPEAIRIGCACPIMDNGHGKGWMGGVKDENGETIFVYTVGCPVHDAKPDAIRALQEKAR